MKRITGVLSGTLLFLLAATSAAYAQDRPNVVLILMDNLGYGELGVYGGGILRGAPTPHIDKLASEGLRLLNYNVEAQCTPSRAALMTGRYAIRTGNGSVPIGTPRYGLVQWEYTMAEMLSDVGYVTGAFGKWHLGNSEGRYPTDQGFDEWYGIPNSSDEAFWPQSSIYRPDSNPGAAPAYLMESTKGPLPRKLKIYDLAERRIIDRTLTDKAKDFMSRQVRAGRPFFAYIPFTMPHHPVTPAPEFDGKTRNGHWADALAQMDAYTAELLETVEKLGVKDNTIFIFTSDNGPEMLEPWTGWGGPWRGTYFTALEGSLRAPFIVRWPSKFPAGSVSNEIVHEMDLFTTIATIAGGKVPTDRVIDGVDQSAHWFGKQEKSNRDSVVVYVGNEIYGVKWQNWKMMFKELATGTGPIEQWSIPRFFNLYLDPREEHSLTYGGQNAWVVHPASKVLADHQASLKKYPPIPVGAADPYTPPEP
ncbi:MAG: arylsulfatase [Alphaproteobacteria bacterium]|nr:arylsulfatase [Alphaproteobacteria bacterium]